ncbi:pilin [Candidatus Saccharibacteria bacterium]|nr:pilin [Candidatus Saccharibacteria bacterium]
MKKLTKILVAGAAALALAFSFVPVTGVLADPVGGLGDGVNQARSNDQPSNLFGDGGIITGVINAVLFIVGILSVVMIIYGGIRYATSAGEAKRVTDAKNTIMYAIVGLIVSILAYAIVNFVIGNIIQS